MSTKDERREWMQDPVKREEEIIRVFAGASGLQPMTELETLIRFHHVEELMAASKASDKYASRRQVQAWRLCCLATTTYDLLTFVGCQADLAYLPARRVKLKTFI